MGLLRQQGGGSKGRRPAIFNWKSRSGRLWGWMEVTPRGGRQLELSFHSRVALARENVRRLTEGTEKYRQ